MKNIKEQYNFNCINLRCPIEKEIVNKLIIVVNNGKIDVYKFPINFNIGISDAEEIKI